jgi:alpha-L-fucosidase 2
MRLTDEQIATTLEQHDLVWDAPPVKWNTGIPLANGRIGAMIWGDGIPLKITLDKYDCWELREQRADPEIYNYQNLRRLIAEGDEDETRRQMVDLWRVDELPHPTRLPMPRLELDFGSCEFSDARLRLHDATAEGNLTTEKGNIAWRAYVHAEQNLLVFDLAYDGPARLVAARVSLDHLDDEAKQTLRDWGYEEPETGEQDGWEWLRLRYPGGGEYVVAWRRITVAPDRDRILVSIVSHRDSDDPLAEALRLATVLDVNEAHADWWREYWRRSSLSIPDSRLEALWWIEMYKLGCSSRPGSLPITLQGLWTADGVMPPWSGDYHLDMNVQESYWPIYAANRLDLGECLYETFDDCIPWWEERCREFFGFEGLWSGCAIAPNGARVYGYHGVE